MRFLITGGAGFIGSAVIRHLINDTEAIVLNLDKLTYAGNLDSLIGVSSSSRYQFVQSDICDTLAVRKIIYEFRPNVFMHLAAESHVDRSIDGPSQFIKTNIFGTYNLLEVARDYWCCLDSANKDKFRFHHVSTDEVYGDLKKNERSIEKSPYKPSSPYSASKASADLLIKSYSRTFKIEVVISNCCNNYGPGQFPEKLIPTIIFNILNNKPIPIYGKGKNSREWIFVEDHCKGLYQIYKKGKNGESYNIGSGINLNNLNLTKFLLKIIKNKKINIGKRVKIKFVKDRPGHDFRYALNSNKIRKNLKWYPATKISDGLEKTLSWYLKNYEFFNFFSKKKFFKRLGLNI